MNKLLVSDIINLKDGSFYLNCEKEKIKIIVDGKVTIYLNNEKLKEIDIDLKFNSILKFYKIDKEIRNDLIVNIKQDDNSQLYYNSSFITNNDAILKINNYINGNNNISNINIRNICLNNNSNIIINVNIKNNTNNNIALEDLRGINNGGIIHIEPNIIASTHDVVANHLTTIGGIDLNSLNYLLSKGISKKEAEKILLKGFFLSNMDNDIKSIIGGDEHA